MAKTALSIMRQDQAAAYRYAAEAGRKRTLRLLEKAQRDLNKRLEQAASLSGPGRDSFTATQIRTVLKQIETVLVGLRVNMKKEIVSLGTDSAEKAAVNAVRYLERAERQFRGVNARLGLNEARVLDRAVVGTESSILHRIEKDPKHPSRKGVLDRYGDNVIKRFEEKLQLRFIAKQPWDQVRNELIASSPFLKEAPAHWSERIVRTEVMAAHNRSGWEAMRVINKEVGGGVVKMLSATFDNRTGSDSIAVHGQIRRPHEAFESWFGLYQHPPNRPNDREVVVPHRLEWPIPSVLAWRSDSEIMARWLEEKRKGSPPPRPTMTTIPLDRFASS